MKIFEQARLQPEVAAQWLVTNEDDWQVLVRKECRHTSHKLHLLTRGLNLSAGEILPCKLFQNVEACLVLIGQLKVSDEIFSNLSKELKGAKQKNRKRRVIFAKPNKSLELLEFLLLKSEQYILDPKNSVVSDIKQAPAFLEMLHKSFSQTEDRCETAININSLCERLVDLERWQKLKNNFTSWHYNRSNNVKGLSITGDAASSLKEVQTEAGLSTASETVLYLVDHYRNTKPAD
jgi:hypothetical protein